MEDKPVKIEQDLEAVETEAAEVDRVFDPPLPEPNRENSGELLVVEAAFKNGMFLLCELLHKYPRLKDESEIVRAIELTGQIRDIIDDLPTSEDYESRRIFNEARREAECRNIVHVGYDFTTYCDLEKGHDPNIPCSTWTDRFEAAEMRRRLSRRRRALPVPAA